MGAWAGRRCRTTVLAVSQIFEALKRSREQHRGDREARRTAQADAVLATMGFASERKPKPRERLAPFLLIVLILLIAWFGWRTYTSEAPQRIATAERAATPQRPPTTERAPQSTQVSATSPPVVKTPSPPLADDRPKSQVSAARRTSAPDAFVLALYYHRLGDFENALLQYRAVLQRNELNPQAHNNLGLLYRDKGLLDDAVKEFQRALAIDAQYVTARNNLGVALMGLKRLDDARAQFAQVLAQEPRHADAMINLALVEKSAGRLELALESLVRATVVDPRSAAAHYNLAVLYEQSGETERAIDHYRAFLARAGAQPAARTAEVRARLAELEKRQS